MGFEISCVVLFVLCLMFLFRIRTLNKRIFTLSDIRYGLKEDLRVMEKDRDWWSENSEKVTEDLIKERERSKKLEDFQWELKAEVLKLRKKDRLDLQQHTDFQLEIKRLKEERAEAVYRIDVLEAALQLKKQM